MPLKRMAWLWRHKRPVDLLLPVLALLVAFLLLWPLLSPPPSRPDCDHAGVGVTNGAGGGR